MAEVEKIEMNYSNFTKIRIYKLAIRHINADIKSGCVFGLCYYIEMAAIELEYAVDSDNVSYNLNMKYNFPEIYKSKPTKAKMHSAYNWFPLDINGMEKRISILKKVIDKLETIELQTTGKV